jgi:hypothetical protein
VPVYTWGETWEQICVAPCTVRGDPHSSYRVNGDVAPSSRFVLPQGQDPVTLHLRTGSGGAYSAGVALTIFGTLALAGGAIVVFVAPSITSAVSESDTRIIGVSLLGGGTLMVAVGLPLWLLTGSSVVTPDGKRLANGDLRTGGVRVTPDGLAF